MRLWQMLIWVTLAAASQTTAEPLSTGEWLLDLERDYRLSSPTGGSDIDDEMCLLFDQAACRLENAPPEAWRAQARLLDVLGRPEDACQALTRYVPLAPDDLRARLWYVSLRSGLLQTAEEREAFFREQLQQPSLPPPVSSELHRLLAEHCWNRNEKAKAGEEARAAVRDDRHNLRSRQLLAIIEGNSDAPETQIELDLLLAELNPGRSEWIATLANDLMATGLPDEAIPWYRHAMALIESHPDAKAGPPLLMSLTWALIEQAANEKAKSEHAAKETESLKTSTKQPTTKPSREKKAWDPPLEEAWKLTEQALGMDRDQVEPYRARMWIARLQDNPQEEENQATIAGEVWLRYINHDDYALLQQTHEVDRDGRTSVEKWPPDVMASYGWFMVHDSVVGRRLKLRNRFRKNEKTGQTDRGTYELNPLDQAKGAADFARNGDPDSIVARRIQGACARQRAADSQLAPDAQARGYREAEDVLLQIADQDAWAAIELAQLLDTTGRPDEANQRLTQAAQKADTAELRLTIRGIWDHWKATRPRIRPATQTATPPASQPWLQPASPSGFRDIQAAVKAFPQAILDFPFHPNQYVTLGARLVGDGLRVGEPWRCEFEIKNISSFPITIGPALMLEPDLLCFITMRGDRERGETISIPLDRLIQLAPGQSLSIIRTLDVGRARSGLIGTPQVAYDVTIETLTNMVATPPTSPDTPPRWVQGIGGTKAKALRLRRELLKINRDSVRDLLTRTKAPAAATRITAMEILASLLAESQHLAAGRLRYVAQPIDPAVVQAAITARGNDEDWQVRARLAECLRWFVLDSSSTQLAVQLLNDPHWLVRGLAMRAMAEQQGAKFKSVLEAVSQQDPDEWVRHVSKTLLARLTAATVPPETQPAATPSTETPAERSAK